MATDIKALHRRGFEEGINQNRLEVFDELIGDTYINHNFPAPAPGREGFKQVIAMFRSAFPDLHVTIEDQVAEGDRVAARGRMAGTHRGEFMGIPATGKPVEIAYADIWRLEDGRFVENWVQMDLLGLMQQLGVVPSPDTAATA